MRSASAYLPAREMLMRRSALLPLLGLALCAAPVAAQGPGRMPGGPGPMPGGPGHDPAPGTQEQLGELVG